MPYKVSLVGAFAKLERAKNHRTGLAAFIEGYFEVLDNRPPVSALLEPTTGYHVFRIDSVPPQIEKFQESVALRIGDCVHNLRSSLDHLVFQLVCVKKSGKPDHPEKTQFPIADTAERFEEQQRRYLVEVDNEHQMVIESYQPYRGRRDRPDYWHGPYIHQLELLKKMSNWDKHRLLHTILTIPSRVHYGLPTGIQAVPPEIRSSGDFVEKSPFRLAGDELLPGIEVIREKLVAQGGQEIPPSLPSIGYVSPSIALEEKRPVVETLERLEKYVELILNDFKGRLV